MSLLAPDTVLQNRYRIVQQIGKGGMGVVYEAVDQTLQCPVAVKQMLVSGVQSSQAFRREAQLLANLRHPALPRLSDYFVDSNGQFLVMDFIEGADLAGLLAARGAPFPNDKVLDWADQLLDALQYLHERTPPVVHRDIKPQNLKLLSPDAVVLLDFGLAKGQLTQTSQLSTASVIGYTPHSAPLEQIEGTATTVVQEVMGQFW